MNGYGSMTNFQLWLKSCEELNASLYPVMIDKNKSGTDIMLYQMIRFVPGSRETGWIDTRVVTYILWVGEDRFYAYTDFYTAVKAAENRRDKYND